MQKAFHEKGLESPRLLAELLLAHVLSTDRLKLYLDQDRPASELERGTLRDLAGRALKHEPVQYLVREAWFFGIPFTADRRALIPRGCTEGIIEYVLQHERARHGSAGNAPAARGSGVLIADIGTGSGCIALALLKHLPAARAVATDVSEDALSLARENAQRHGLADRVDFLRGDLFAPLSDHPATRGGACVEYLVSNPPYIPDEEWPGSVDDNVRLHEPALALRGGADGLQFVRPLIAGVTRWMKPGGVLMVEVARVTAEAALTLAQSTPGLVNARIEKDHEGLDRFIVASTPRAG